jgi:hypothetical protein
MGQGIPAGRIAPMKVRFLRITGNNFFTVNQDNTNAAGHGHSVKLHHTIAEKSHQRGIDNHLPSPDICLEIQTET